MTKLKIKTTIQSELDIIEIGKYIGQYNKIAAKSILNKIRSMFLTLADYPELGKNRSEFTDDNNIYFFAFQSRYLIVYTINQEELLILRVLSSYQNICKIL